MRSQRDSLFTFEAATQQQSTDDVSEGLVLLSCVHKNTLMGLLAFSINCSGYRYRTTSFNKAWPQVLAGSNPARSVSEIRGSLTIIPAGNKAKHLSSVYHTTKTIHHHHHHHHHHHYKYHHHHHHHYQIQLIFLSSTIWEEIQFGELKQEY